MRILFSFSPFASDHAFLDVVDVEPGVNPTVTWDELPNVPFEKELLGQRQVRDTRLTHTQIPEHYGIVGKFDLSPNPLADFLVAGAGSDKFSIGISRNLCEGEEMIIEGSSTFSVVHCGGDVEFTDGEVEHGD